LKLAAQICIHLENIDNEDIIATKTSNAKAAISRNYTVADLIVRFRLSSASSWWHG
jgi:hypothetical protein